MKAITIERAEPMSSPPTEEEQRLVTSRRVAARCMSLAAGLAVMAAGLQLYDSLQGQGSYWRVLGAAGVALWWIAMAVFFRHRRRP
jgi:hypothetical protein